MSRDRQRSDDQSPSTGRGGSDVDQQERAAPKPEEEEERKLSATLRKKNTALSSKTSAERTQQELAEGNLDPPSNYSARPKGEHIYEWRPTILGPPGSVYDSGVFFLDITFSPYYPLKVAVVTFCTRNNNWSPAWTISKVLLSLCSHLTHGVPMDPLVRSIAAQYSTNRAKHDGRARQESESEAA
uniref:ubiquitin-conjugating enzyme E2 E3-like n=1 Tax=Halichoerus grypus TaxID=9711 RepID=UPI0016590F94|nr:ubiquitin-conjugating enzyme E2 E3-like [Halichoerus grypus]